jgi:cytochrome c1
VWENEGALTANPEIYPWPYQLVAIEGIRFQEKYSKLFPKGEPKDSAHYQGFLHFKNQCLRCHSINLEGGDLAPELNIPRNITEYRDRGTLKLFIKNASDFRARSKMPAFPGLKDSDVEQILSYLDYMKTHKINK